MEKDMIKVGIDVDSQYLVCRRLKQGRFANKTFSNCPEGHAKLIGWVSANGSHVQACMEATGVYSFAVALALSEQEGIEVSVMNPRLIKNFAQAWLQRGKTDQLDAGTILEYLIRMPFEPWQAPKGKLLSLQLLSRRILQLTTELRREKSRRHAALRMGKQGKFLVHDIEVNMRHLKRRIEVIESQMLKLVSEEGQLQRQYDQLKSITGIADKIAPRLLAELSSLPTDMKAKQWVAYAGLDPRPYESGTLVKPRRISKLGNRYLRDALYLPAMTAARQNKSQHTKAWAWREYILSF